MLTRFLGGTVACLGAAGMLPAQQPLAIPAAPPMPPPDQVVRAEPLAPPATLPTTAKPADASKPTDASKPAADAKAAVPHTAHSQILTNGGCSPVAVPCPTDCAPACCVPCGPPGRAWVDAGYIFWTTRGQNLPPLITSAPAGTARPVAGTLGGPGTQILTPGRANDDFRSGFYLNGGFWFDECQTCGIEGNFFFLGDSTDRFSAGAPAGSGSIITRPFFNTVGGQPDTQLVSFPDVLSGRVDVETRNRVIGGGPNFIKNLCCGPCGRFDLLLGYTYLNVNDSVAITESLVAGPGQPGVAPGTTFVVRDRFNTNNNFHGVNIGFAAEKRWSHWYLGVRAGVALGVNNQSVTISGSTTITPPGGEPQTFPGGLLAQPSNIGVYRRDTFAVMPWVGVRLGAQLTERVRAYVGYDFFALTDVVRAGDQIDLRVNPTQIPPRTNGVQGEAFPQFNRRETTFWGQGVRIGMEVRF